MKTFNTYLVGLALVGGMTTLSYAQLAPQATEARLASLAEQLPADTLLYFEVPDFLSVREGIRGSSLGKTYGDPEMETFLAESLGMLDESWGLLRGMSGGMGIPEGLTYWDGLESIEGGLAFRGNPEVENPFSADSQVYGMLRIGLKEGLGNPVFQLLTMALEEEGMELVGSENGDLLVMNTGKASVEIYLDGDALIASILKGAKGEGSLASTAKFVDARNATFTEGSVVFGYLQWNTAVESLLKAISYEAPMFHGPASRFYERGMKPLTSVSLASGWTEEGTFTNVRVGMSGDGDGLYAIGNANLDLLKYVPSDASSFSLSAEVPQMGAFFMDTLDDFAGVEIGGMVLRDKLAMEVPEVHTWLFGEKRPELDAAIAGVGNQSVAYGTSANMQSEVMMLTELTDGAAVSNMMTQLMPRFREMLDTYDSPVRLGMKRVALRVKQDDGSTKNVKGPAYYMVDFAFMDEMPAELGAFTGAFQPTFGVTEDGWLVSSMSKQPVRRALMNGVEVPSENINANPEAEEFLASLKGGAYALSWSDPRPTVDAAAGLAMGVMPMLLGMAGGEMDLPFEVEKLPSAELFSRYLRPSTSAAWRNETESMYHHVGSVGLADIFTVTGALVAIGPPSWLMIFELGSVSDASSAPGEYEEF